jgi:hypothetical protein
VESRGLAVISTGSAGRTMTPASGIQLLDEKFPSFFKKKIATIIFVTFQECQVGLVQCEKLLQEGYPAFLQKLCLTFPLKFIISLSPKFLTCYLTFLQSNLHYTTVI